MNAEQRKQFNWTTIAEIESNGEISCIDGRHSHCVVGAPGGNIGEFILLLGATEKLADIMFSAEQVQQLLANYASTFGRFYMHTDSFAVGRLLRACEQDSVLKAWASTFNGDVEQFFTALPSIDRATSEAILPYMLQSEHIGCGHLNLLQQEAASYAVRSQLVEHVMCGFFNLMWGGYRRMHWEMLEGEHQEKQVVVIDAEKELEEASEIPFACSDAEQRFVMHSAARRFFHRRDALFMNRFLAHTVGKQIDVQKFVEGIESIADLQLNNTLDALAKDLPVVRVVVDGDDENENAA